MVLTRVATKHGALEPLELAIRYGARTPGVMHTHSASRGRGTQRTLGAVHTQCTHSTHGTAPGAQWPLTVGWRCAMWRASIPGADANCRHEYRGYVQHPIHLATAALCERTARVLLGGGADVAACNIAPGGPLRCDGSDNGHRALSPADMVCEGWEGATSPAAKAQLESFLAYLVERGATLPATRLESALVEALTKLGGGVAAEVRRSKQVAEERLDQQRALEALEVQIRAKATEADALRRAGDTQGARAARREGHELAARLREIIREIHQKRLQERSAAASGLFGRKRSS